MILFFLNFAGVMTHTFLQFDNAVFTNSPGESTETNIDLTLPLVTKHDCIMNCIYSLQCNVVLVAYKSGFSHIHWCNFYSVDLTTIQILVITPNISEPWSTVFSTDLHRAMTSQLFITGNITASINNVSMAAFSPKRRIDHKRFLVWDKTNRQRPWTMPIGFLDLSFI